MSGRNRFFYSTQGVISQDDFRNNNHQLITTLANICFTISYLDSSDKTALWAQCYGFGEFGESKWDCSNCDDYLQKINGCGFFPEYRHRGTWKNRDNIDFQNTCPGWFLNSDFIYSFLKYYKIRKTMDLANTNNRFIEALIFYESLEQKKINRELKNQAVRNKKNA